MNTDYNTIKSELRRPIWRLIPTSDPAGSLWELDLKILQIRLESPGGQIWGREIPWRLISDGVLIFNEEAPALKDTALKTILQRIRIIQNLTPKNTYWFNLGLKSGPSAYQTNLHPFTLTMTPDISRPSYYNVRISAFQNWQKVFLLHAGSEFKAQKQAEAEFVEYINNLQKQLIFSQEISDLRKYYGV